MSANILIRLLIFNILFVSFSSNFIEFGTSNGDSKLPQIDDFYKSIDLNSQFIFEKKNYSNFYLSTNGAIIFDNELTSVTSSFPSQISKTIAPYLSDIDTSKNGNIYFRQTNDTYVLSSIQRDLNILDFHVFLTWAFIVTWNEVAPFAYSSLNIPKNTFQLVLATDGQNSFAIFNYGLLQWENDFVAGIKNEYRKSFNIISNSSKTLMSESNANFQGKWIYQVDKLSPFTSSTKFTSTKLSTTSTKAATKTSTTIIYFSKPHLNYLNLILSIVLTCLITIVCILSIRIMRRIK